MTVIDFNVLECKRLLVHSPTIKRTVKDYEIDYCMSGSRDMYIDSVKHRMTVGDICFRRPGQEVHSNGDYDCFILTLDFTKTVPVEAYSRNAAVKMQTECLDENIVNLPSVLKPINAARIKSIFSSLESQLDFNSDVSKALVKELLYCMNADNCHDYYEKNKQNLTSIDHIARYINQNFASKITLDMLAKEAFLDRSYLVRAFKKRYGCTPIKYLIDVRLTHAKDILLNTNAPIYEIAEECGYNTESFFISQYRSKYGMSPAQHRQFVWNNNDIK